MNNKLRDFLDRYRLERRANNTVAKAQRELARLRRLTPDGLDPKDPDDAFAIHISNSIKRDMEASANRYRSEQIRQIAYRLMESELSPLTLDQSSQQGVHPLVVSSKVYEKAVKVFELIQEAEKHHKPD